MTAGQTIIITTRKRKRDDPMLRASGVVTSVFLGLALLGWVTDSPETHPSTDCTAVERRTDINPDAYAALQARGYTVQGNTLRSPGCDQP